MQIDRVPEPAPAEIVSMADEIRGWCAVITKIARADLQFRLDTYDAGISAIEHGVLRHLSRGVSSMADISQLMGIAPSTLVYVVDGLVKKRLVKRRKDPKDRRREPLTLEKKGADLFDKIPKMDPNSVLVKSLERMTESQRRQLVELLNQFVAGLPGSERLRMLPESDQGSIKRGAKS
ncbi:MAG TPA: MarR family transcriptional regulator [Bryobacteraceae bacterium]|jgi:DNA-binding MarR family transcriptional regulator|nr:MarR family transcriptional regulator [Bryobacteraceae bacterium]